MTAQAYNVDLVHSSVGFSVRHMVVAKTRGHFDKWSATLLLDDEDLTRSSVEVHIDAASINTKETARDNHLRSADFFDVAKFPELTFKSRRVEQAGTNQYRIIGDLTIHGVSKEVTLDAEFNGREKSPWGDVRVGFSAGTTINRTDWGLGWNKALETGGLLVGEKVEINIELEAAVAAAVKAA
jgi:polyisoprenoid-binding protein YceI